MQSHAVTIAAIDHHRALPVQIFSTAPQSDGIADSAYLARLAAVSRWSEQAGCTGMLIYTDNRLVDAWLVAQIAIQNTERLCPLVATQPVYMHPYTVAKMVSTFGHLYGRRIYLNMVAGGFRNDLLALGDDTPHDARYQRLLEYTTIIKELLRGDAPVTFAGRFYRIENLLLKPPLPPQWFPGIFLSGSSEAGMAAARALDATAIEYPNPVDEYRPCGRVNAGIRIGIIAAESEDAAWQIAYERFPGDRKGQLTHKLTMKISDSEWHKQLSRLDEKLAGQRSVYWLWPFKNYKTFCPYLVGSHEQVAGEVATYIRAGFTNFILDIPAEEWDLCAAGTVFRLAASRCVAT